jgi:hypothetical protein
MDLTHRFERMRERAAALPAADACMLLAPLAAEQAMLPTAIAAARLAGLSPAPVDRRRALVALFSGSGDWAIAAASLGGSFHPRIATAAAGKAGSTLMKPGFTFAF